MRTALIGAYAGSVQAFAELMSGSELSLVVTTDRPPGDQLAAIAANRGVSVLRGPRVKDPGFASEIRARGIDLLINVLAPHVICPEVIEAPGIGAFNLHPSLLPRYGGRNPTAWAIYHGETTHGATLHWIDTGLDTGPIALQVEVPINDAHQPISLLRDTMRAGTGLIRQLLVLAATDHRAIPRIPQDLTRRRYFGKEAPEGGRLTWDRPARSVVNFVRAFDYAPIASPWGYVRATIDGVETSIGKAYLTGESCAGFAPGAVRGHQIATADEWVRVTNPATSSTIRV